VQDSRRDFSIADFFKEGLVRHNRSDSATSLQAPLAVGKWIEKSTHASSLADYGKPILRFVIIFPAPVKT
jgi:hypothetical protein